MATKTKSAPKSRKSPARKFKLSFKKAAVERLASGNISCAALAKELDISEVTLNRWRRGLDMGGVGRRHRQAQALAPTLPVLPHAEPIRPPEGSVVTKLYAVIGQLMVENQELREQLARR